MKKISMWLPCIFYLMLSLSSGMETGDFRLHSPAARMEGNPVVRILSRLSLIRCAAECARNPSLIAFNYNAGAKLCEMMAKNEGNLSGTLTSNNDYNYYVRFSRAADLPSCSSKPCLYGSRCVPTPNGLDYSCLDCPAYFGGKNCGDLMCGAYNCSLFNDSVIFFKVEMPLTLEEANQWCVGQGMTLAMPKDNLTNAFLVEFLRSVYGKEAMAAGRAVVVSWLGLRCNGSECSWVDGSPLGAYLGGGNKDWRSSWAQYGLTLGADANNDLWSPVDTTATNNFICQRRIDQAPPCTSNPCLYGGRCVPTPNGLDYTCLDCPAYFGGKNCEVLNCGLNSCGLFNDSVIYFVVQSELIWVQARQECTCQGAIMAMPKDLQSNQFVADLLTSVNGQNSSQLLVWLGLRKQSPNWTWLDGSLLGDYVVNNPDFQNSTGTADSAALSVDGATLRWVPSYATRKSFNFVCQRPIQQPPSCVFNPCMYGSSCVPTKDGLDYSCSNCPPYLSGKNCDVFAAELQCEGVACFQFNGTKYVVYGSRSCWVQANRTCTQEEGMTLAMLKEPETSAYVISQLERLFCQSSVIRFWFGLKTYENSGWRWMDGSVLGAYTGNRTDFAPNVVQKCASLNVYGSGIPAGHMGWYVDDCVQAANYRYYPLCEKIIL